MTERAGAVGHGPEDRSAGSGAAPQLHDVAAPRAWTAVRVVAAREIAVKLRDKAFIGSTVFMLLLVTAATLIPVLISQQIPQLRVAVELGGELGDGPVSY